MKSSSSRAAGKPWAKATSFPSTGTGGTVALFLSTPAPSGTGGIPHFAAEQRRFRKCTGTAWPEEEDLSAKKWLFWEQLSRYLELGIPAGSAALRPQRCCGMMLSFGGSRQQRGSGPEICSLSTLQRL